MTTGLWLVTWTSAHGVEHREALETESVHDVTLRWVARPLRFLGDALDAWDDDEGAAVDGLAAKLAGGAAFRVERLTVDDTTLDATDGAHPAWWRGHDHTEARMRAQVEAMRAERDEARAALAALKGGA